jgi:hypothetical protein
VTPHTYVASFTPGGGWTVVMVPLASSQRIETVGPSATALALGVIDERNAGDAGTFGIPALLHVAAGPTFGAVRPAGVVVPRRAFGPVVAIDGAGRDVIVYQEKDRAAAFSREGPVYAATAAPSEPLSARRRLDGGLAYEPAVLPYGRGAIVAWQASGSRWRVSIERGGVFRSAPAPAGRGPSRVGEDFNYNHDMAAAGRHVALVWTAQDGSIRASVGTP